MDIKQKYREEISKEPYCQTKTGNYVKSGSYSDHYVKWLEKQLALCNVVGRSEQSVRDTLLKSREETARVREATAIKQTIQQQAVDQITQSLVDQLDKILIEGLKRRGYGFDNKAQLTQFIKQRCRCVVDQRTKTKMYYVDDRMFLIHNYNTQITLQVPTQDVPFKILGQLGSFYFV